MAVKVLCVAEKPSIARAVATHLSGDDFRTNPIPGNQYVKNYTFSCRLGTWGQADVTMTSVLGHLMSQDFRQGYRKWYECDPSALFEAPIEVTVAEKMVGVANNIKAKARNSDYLYIWTDCDREGENIGSEIRGQAASTNPRLLERGRTMRARFSNIERAHILNAAAHPVALDQQQIDAVNSRLQLDLRIGASFTRFLTMNLQNILPPNGEGKQPLISYGSCQFPTLGFVVERYFRVRNFVPETFWGIKVMHEREEIPVQFKWARNHLFDRMAVVIIFERCLAARTAKVVKVLKRKTSKWKPLPLTTVELQKCGSRFLHMTSADTLKAAESLYQAGWISYPRTETDQFDKDMDLRALVQKQTQGGPWAAHAQGLVNGGFAPPRNGRNNDKAHPPIHPVNFVVPATLTDIKQRKVHEFVVRRFLACCSQDAEGFKTEIGLKYGSEFFNASGLEVISRNYLDVYPYDRWTSSQPLPTFVEGETFEPTEATMTEGSTSPPQYLTEPELIALMDANGIGTDATMADHIEMIQTRQYAQVRARTGAARGQGGDASDNDEGEDAAPRGGRQGGRGGGRGRGRGNGRGGGNARGGGGGNAVQEFIPTTLGVGLVQGYEALGLNVSLARPFLRKEMEDKMKQICDGRKTEREVVDETVTQYRDVYHRSDVQILRGTLQRYMGLAAG